MLNQVLNNIPFIIAGPCSIESEYQINRIAEELSSAGIRLLRGGAFKPRTSPESFQGLGKEGLVYMREAADKNNMFVVSEVLETEQLEANYDMIDMIQIGSRNMSSTGFLKQVGKMSSKDQKPVLLKRGFSATLDELLSAADYILHEGNENIILCLRGIRTFEQINSSFRFTPDLASILELREKTNLKIIFDPSHAAGQARYIRKISDAALSLGVDGLIIESHYDPENAKSDKDQCILPKEVIDIYNSVNTPELV